jgi:hypothetical protein
MPTLPALLLLRPNRARRIGGTPGSPLVPFVVYTGSQGPCLRAGGSLGPVSGYFGVQVSGLVPVLSAPTYSKNCHAPDVVPPPTVGGHPLKSLRECSAHLCPTAHPRQRVRRGPAPAVISEWRVFYTVGAGRNSRILRPTGKPLLFRAPQGVGPSHCPLLGILSYPTASLVLPPSS